MPAAHLLVGIAGASAFGAPHGASADSENGRQGDLRPGPPGQGPGDVHGPHHALYHDPVVEYDAVQVVRHIGEAVVVHSAARILPYEVRDGGEVLPLGQRLHHADGGLLGGVPAHDQVDLRALDQLFPEVRGGESSELGPRIRMVLLDQLGELQRPVGMGHPMEVDAVHVGVDALDLLLGIELLVGQHLAGDVDDTDPVAGRYELCRDRHEPDGVHLENGGRRDDVAHGTVEYGLLAEVVHAGGVEEDHVVAGRSPTPRSASCAAGTNGWHGAGRCA